LIYIEKSWGNLLAKIGIYFFNSALKWSKNWPAKKAIISKTFLSTEKGWKRRNGREEKEREWNLWDLAMMPMEFGPGEAFREASACIVTFDDWRELGYKRVKKKRKIIAAGKFRKISEKIPEKIARKKGASLGGKATLCACSFVDCD
jgi:hypothetical protein